MTVLDLIPAIAPTVHAIASPTADLIGAAVSGTTHLADGLTQEGPNWGAPGVKIGKWLMGVGVAIGLILCGIAVICGGGGVAIGRAMGHGTAQKVGLGFVIGGIVGAALIGSAAAIVNAGFNNAG